MTRRVQAFQRVDPDPDADRNEGTEAAMDPRAERDPFFLVSACAEAGSSSARTRRMWDLPNMGIGIYEIGSL
jgi:hypothetical protein